MLEHFKDTPINVFKTRFFYFSQKSVPGLKNLLILMLMYLFYILWKYSIFSTCVGVIHTSASIIFVARVNSAIFHLFCTFLQGWLVKNNHSIYPTDTFFTQCLLLSMFDKYRSLALLYM